MSDEEIEAALRNYISNEDALRTFHKIVNTKTWAKRLPKEQQPALAAQLVEEAKRWNKGVVTAEFIDLQLHAWMQDAVHKAVQENKRAKEQAEAADVWLRWHNRCDDFERACRAMWRAADQMLKMQKEHPDLKFTLGRGMDILFNYGLKTFEELAEKLRRR